jgi:hypothetical protein
VVAIQVEAAARPGTSTLPTIDIACGFATLAYRQAVGRALSLTIGLVVRHGHAGGGAARERQVRHVVRVQRIREMSTTAGPAASCGR